MLVSILMPMHNAQHYINETLDSIFDGEYQNIEVVIIDDGSTDDSLKIVKQYNDSRIRVVSGERNGIAMAFNRALALADGQLIMRCDADDLYATNRIFWQVAWLNKNLDYDGICSDFGVIDEGGDIINGELNDNLISGNITGELKNGKVRTHFCTYCIKKNILQSLNGCREYFITAEDIDLQLRLGEVANIWYENRVSYLYRLHDTSITHTQQNSQRIFYEEIAKVFQKQRLSNGIDDLEYGDPPIGPQNQEEKPNSAKEHIINMHHGMAWKLHRRKNKTQALRCLSKAFMLSPLNLTTWKYIVIIIVK
tara:strand:+ start:3181 stop:4107 length:927 start_codon:yes stop_codon:yes gene_type:complete